jgi:hypothetical protein
MPTYIFEHLTDEQELLIHAMAGVFPDRMKVKTNVLLVETESSMFFGMLESIKEPAAPPATDMELFPYFTEPTNSKPRTIFEKVCERCGKTYQTSHEEQKYCSKSCGAKQPKPGRTFDPAKLATCPQCGGENQVLTKSGVCKPCVMRKAKTVKAQDTQPAVVVGFQPREKHISPAEQALQQRIDDIVAQAQQNPTSGGAIVEKTFNGMECGIKVRKLG